MVILNLTLPIIILIVTLMITQKIKSSKIKKIFGILGGGLCLFTLPLIIFDYHYYNWVLEYLKLPVMLISFALLLSIFVNSKYFRLSIISLLSLAFALNFTYQFVLHMAGMGGSWIPHGCPNFKPPLTTFENYNLIEGGVGYLLHKTKFNGVIYKQVAHERKSDSDCKTSFDFYKNNKSVVFDSCKNELSFEKI